MYHPLKWRSVAKMINELKPKAVIFRYWTPFLAPSGMLLQKDSTVISKK